MQKNKHNQKKLSFNFKINKISMNKWKNKLTNIKKKLPYCHNKIIDSLNCPKINKIKSTGSNKKSKKTNK